ncbi:putative GMC oxidoreductase [Hypomontagnella monticulosa]|nr:putative GMC oxidoreductase [Hypomontagnella monticulosa]
MVATEGWDYIVVGGGLAGCVLASRLKEYQKSARILIVEAGPDVSKNSEILKYSSLNFVGGEFDWAYKSAPQKNYGGRQVDIPSGRALGGGSVINGCGWFRGSKADYDSWGEAVGDERWSYDGQLPYFKKTEKWYNGLNSDQHGQDGKFSIESPISTDRIYPLANLLEKAWEEQGVHKLPGVDFNAGTNIGFGEVNENRAKGIRQIAPLAYPLDGITILTDTVVGSILLDSGNNAIGIRLANGTEIHSAEVIVAAGAYRSPQLLMLSGIGPKETLDKHGIAVKADVPDVGKNFSDHLMVYLNWKLKDPSKGYALGSSNPMFREPRFGSGVPISYVANTQVPRHLLEAAIVKDEGQVDPNHYLLKREWALTETMVMYIAFPPVPTDGTHISTAQMGLKPTSHGTITIASADPADSPVIDPNYFTTEVDKAVWRHSLRMITNHDGRHGVRARGRRVDEYLDSRVRTHGESTYHGCGSCSMGKVVDTELRVKGVQNLRVVDASVFPISIGAHIMAAVYALAEQAAVIITEGKRA